jgi:hypothetical protein
VREVVLPLDASVRAHARVEEDAARRRLARAAETEGESAVDELVAARPVGRPAKNAAIAASPFGSIPGVMSTTTSSRTSSGCAGRGMPR